MNYGTTTYQELPEEEEKEGGSLWSLKFFTVVDNVVVTGIVVGRGAVFFPSWKLTHGFLIFPQMIVQVIFYEKRGSDGSTLSLALGFGCGEFRLQWNCAPRDFMGPA